MNILEWLQENVSAGAALICGLVALCVWVALWKLVIVRILKKKKVYSMIELGALGSFGILFFIVLTTVLFIASIQALGEYGAKMILPLFAFWGIVTAAIIFIVVKIKKK